MSSEWHNIEKTELRQKVIASIFNRLFCYNEIWIKQTQFVEHTGGMYRVQRMNKISQSNQREKWSCLSQYIIVDSITHNQDINVPN